MDYLHLTVPLYRMANLTSYQNYGMHIRPFLIGIFCWKIKSFKLSSDFDYFTTEDVEHLKGFSQSILALVAGLVNCFLIEYRFAYTG